jgi:ATP-dependent RNA helicase DDX56/DBP9
VVGPVRAAFFYWANMQTLGQMSTHPTDHHLLDEHESFQMAGKKWGLDDRLTKAIAKLGFVYPTLVQAKCLPFALEGKDVLVHARTGSGKTASYCLPVIQKILQEKGLKNCPRGVRAVILVPTRELCGQVLEQLEALLYYCKDAVTALSFANENLETQQAWLREQPDIVISTPLRAAKHLQSGHFDTAEVHTLIVDEADLVLSYGYANDVKTIVEKLPKTCQSLLMSATLSDDLEKLRRVVLRNPVLLRLETGKTDGKLQQFYLTIPAKDKDLLLYAMIKLGIITGKALFFVNDVETCYRKKLIMEQFGIHAAVLNAELPFNSRQHIIREFNQGVFDILIATDESMYGVGPNTAPGVDDDRDSHSEDGDSSSDEAAPTSKEKSVQPNKLDKEYGVSRGVDFHGVTIVVNLDFPRSIEAYTHRIGRTARGGSNGTAISLIEDGNFDELKMLAMIQEEQPRLYFDDLANGEVVKGLQSEHEEGAYQPSPLEFNIGDIEGFRYRVEDTKRSVTRVAVKAARVRELKQEMLNSARLKDHFKENPQDLQILQHAAPLKPHLVKKHLAHVPEYLIPADMRPKTKVIGNKKKRKKRSTASYSTAAQKKNMNQKQDPLQSFSYDGDIAGDSVETDEAEREGEQRHADGSAVRATTTEHGTTGRHKEWQRRHKKGVYSKKFKTAVKNKKRKTINAGHVNAKDIQFRRS